MKNKLLTYISHPSIQIKVQEQEIEKKLMEVMAKLKELESTQGSETAAPQKDPMKSEKIDAAVKAFEDSMKSSDGAEAQPIREDNLHACALMAARRFAAVDESQKALERFVGTDSSLSPGEAAKTAVFRSIVICLKQLDDAGLDSFKKAGGFSADSTRSLPDEMAQEAESRKAYITWSGAVFQLGFDKPRWNLLRRILARHLNPAKDGVKSEAVKADKAPHSEL